ncbi:MAG: IS3 family transposase, partial [Psychromonas sp.]|nr:IS3 family transposase [Psychromonas sp.]
MTDKIRKERASFTPDQKLKYAKLITEEGYTSKQIMEISGAGQTAVSRWKKQYLSEQIGKIDNIKTALDPQL